MICWLCARCQQDMYMESTQIQNLDLCWQNSHQQSWLNLKKVKKWEVEFVLPICCCQSDKSAGQCWIIKLAYMSALPPYLKHESWYALLYRLRGFASWYDNMISCDTATACCDDLELCNALQLRSVGLSWHIWSVLIWSVVVLLQAAGAVCVGRWMGSELPAMPALCRTLNPPCRHRPQLEARANLKQHGTTGSTRINKGNKEYMESDYDYDYDYIVYDIILWFMIHDGISGWCQVHLGGFTLIYLE